MPTKTNKYDALIEARRFLEKYGKELQERYARTEDTAEAYDLGQVRAIVNVASDAIFDVMNYSDAHLRDKEALEATVAHYN